MANCQNNMCYNCQMNRNSGCRSTMSNTPSCRPMPVPEPKPDCGCRNNVQDKHHCRHDALEDLPIAMAYVPWQKWRDVCEVCKGFQKGTIFEELVKPFYGKGGCNR